MNQLECQDNADMDYPADKVHSSRQKHWEVWDTYHPSAVKMFLTVSRPANYPINWSCHLANSAAGTYQQQVTRCRAGPRELPERLLLEASRPCSARQTPYLRIKCETTWLLDDEEFTVYVHQVVRRESSATMSLIGNLLIPPIPS